MGVDNVLGVAGAAQGSFLLVVLGLLISVPIMIWGSTLVLKLVDRHPWIITVGAGVLIWTATQMILDEKLLSEYLPSHSWFDEVSGAILTFAIRRVHPAPPSQPRDADQSRRLDQRRRLTDASPIAAEDGLLRQAGRRTIWNEYGNHWYMVDVDGLCRLCRDCDCG